METNRENMGFLTITRKVSRNAENKVQPQRSGNSVSIWDSSKAKMTRGHRDPSFESNTPCGSMNRQRFSAAFSIFLRTSDVSYWLNLLVFDPLDAPLRSRSAN